MHGRISPEPHVSSWSSESRESPAAGENESLSHIERRILDAGKAEHRQTTDSARRALQVAEQTVEIGSHTLIEVHRQGQQLDGLNGNFDTLQSEVQEANRLIKFMQRCCCFAVLCCCCGDSDAKLDKSRKRRVSEQQKRMKEEEEYRLTRLNTKAEAVFRMSKRNDPAYNGDDDAARSELFFSTTTSTTPTPTLAAVSAAEEIKHRRRYSSKLKLKQQQHQPQQEEGEGRATDIGIGLPDEDRREIQAETEVQDVILDRIGDAVETMKEIGREMQEELGQQDGEIDAVESRAVGAQVSLKTLSKSARGI